MVSFNNEGHNVTTTEISIHMCDSIILYTVCKLEEA